MNNQRSVPVLASGGFIELHCLGVKQYLISVSGGGAYHSPKLHLDFFLEAGQNLC